MSRTMGLGVLIALALVLPAGADAATYCVGSPPGCAGINALSVEAAISAATLGPTVEDDVIRIGAGTWPANHLRIPANTDGALLIDGEGRGQTIFTRSTADPIAQVDDAEATIRDLGVVVPSGAGFDRALELYRGTAEDIAVTDMSNGAQNTGIVMAGGALLRRSTVVLAGENPIGVEVFNVGDATILDSTVSGCRGVIGSTPGRVTVRRTRVVAAKGVESREGSMEVDSSVVLVRSRSGCPTSAALLFNGPFTTARGFSAHNVTADGPAGSCGGPGSDCAVGLLLQRGSGANVMATAVASSVFTEFDSTVQRSTYAGGDQPETVFSASAFDHYSAMGMVAGPEPNFDNPVAGFVDPSSGDFRLTAASELIDRGATVAIAGESTTDMGGGPRIVGGRRDIGAYEFTPSPAGAGPQVPGPPAAPGVPAPPGGVQPSAVIAPPPPRPRLTIPAQRLRLDRQGRLPVRLRCAGARCTGTLVLRATKRVRVKGRSRLVTFGRATFAVPAGREATVRVRISSRALLERLGRVAVTAGTVRKTLTVARARR